MSLLQAFFFGIVQGLTEFIPISSTAHLLLVQTLFRLPVSEAMFAFLVLVQWGTVLSLVLYFWPDWLALARAFLAPPLSTPQNRLAWYLLLGTVPALLAGALLKKAVDALFSQPLLWAGIRLWTAAFLLALAEILGKRQRSLDSLTAADALIIGLFQVLAIFPGASRSSTTLSGGLFRGLDRPAAARFAFLLALPVMVAAGAYELFGLFRAPLPAGYFPALLLGTAVSAVSGWLAIHWLLRYLQRHSLWGFAVYCAGLGSLSVVVFFLMR